MYAASADRRILEDNRSIEARTGCTNNNAVYHSNKLLSAILQTSSSAEALEGSIPSMMDLTKMCESASARADSTEKYLMNLS